MITPKKICQKSNQIIKRYPIEATIVDAFNSNNKIKVNAIWDTGANRTTISGDIAKACLLGADIVAMGDFAISNYNGKTIVNFRFPSSADINFA